MVFEKQMEHSYNLGKPDPYAMTKLGSYLKHDHPFSKLPWLFCSIP